jgi:hypothetical protein
MARLPCSGCSIPVLTTEESKDPKCLDCRRNARMKDCQLCRSPFDPLERGNTTASTCADCKPLYRHTSPGSWIALLASK